MRAQISNIWRSALSCSLFVLRFYVQVAPDPHEQLLASLLRIGDGVAGKCSNGLKLITIYCQNSFFAALSLHKFSEFQLQLNQGNFTDPVL